MGGRVWTQEIEDWIYAKKEGILIRNMTEMVNAEFGTNYTEGQVRSLYKNRHWRCHTGTYHKGNIPWTKGKKQSDYMSPEAIERTKATRFKPGETRGVHYPVNTITWRKDPSGAAYMWIKIAEPAIWQMLHIYVWEKANGKKPKSHVVTFLDGDHWNVSLDNLACIAKGDSIRMNAMHLRCSDAELTKAGARLVRLKSVLSKKRKEVTSDEKSHSRPE